MIFQPFQFLCYLFLAVSVNFLISGCKQKPTNSETKTTTEAAAEYTYQDTFITEPANVIVEDWVKALEVPWALVFINEKEALVTERPGRIRRIVNGVLRPEYYAKPEVEHIGEGGLMGMDLHPQFPDSPYVYIMYTYRSSDGLVNRVERYRHLGESGEAERIIIDDIPAARIHNGGRIAFGPDGMLYITTGDAGVPNLAQDKNSLAGKILRLTPTGGIPADNPFENSPVYSLGHRNPQGLAWHEDGRLFQTEHGPTGDLGYQAHDEINIIEVGGNYGWPKVVGKASQKEFIDPLIVWENYAVPPGGAVFYKEDLFVATLRSRALLRISFDENIDDEVNKIERWFATANHDGAYGRLRDVSIGPDNHLYVLTSNKDGRGNPNPGDDKILRLILD